MKVNGDFVRLRNVKERCVMIKMEEEVDGYALNANIGARSCGDEDEN